MELAVCFDTIECTDIQGTRQTNHHIATNAYQI